MDIPQIDGTSLLSRIEALAAIGRTAVGGVSRPGFSTPDLTARDHLSHLVRRDGLTVWTDAAGNMFVAAEAAPGHPVALLGSHLDTVPNGGRLDGAYGVLAAIEVIQALRRSKTELSVTPVAVAFANEEGALFPQPFWGSLALVGRTDLLALSADPRDGSGNSLREPLRLAGGDLDAIYTAAWPAGSIAGYLELHIEQGPVLERAGASIGIVTAITGRSVVSVTVSGTAGHAGTVPMRGRKDAAVTAARIVLAVQDLAASRGHCRVATTGRVEIEPGVPNVIPGTARLTVDIRDEDPARLDHAESVLLEMLRAFGEQSGTEVAAEVTTRTRPVPTDPGLRAAIAGCAAEVALPSLELPSGAGHDAQIIAQVAPVGMIFVPSRGGLSHVPGEDTADADLVAGAQVLLRTVLRQWSAADGRTVSHAQSIANRRTPDKAPRYAHRASTRAAAEE